MPKSIRFRKWKTNIIAHWVYFSILSSVYSIAHAETVTVAVAANFTKTMRELKKAFERNTGHDILISFASTGQLFAQISHGAPFDIFLAADTARPDRLISKGLALRSSAFIYAQGRLALWSSNAHMPLNNGRILKELTNDHKLRLAIPNPKLAPYGAAAIETLMKLNTYHYWQSRLITGQSVAHTHQFIASGNVAIGFIALSQAKTLPDSKKGTFWAVPAQLHTPINQKAIHLTRARENPAAIGLMRFLRSPEAKAIIEQFGYSIALPSLEEASS